MKGLQTIKSNPLINDATTERIRLREAASIQSILLSLIDEGDNVRTIYDDESIKELSDSILKYGLIQPISLIENGTRYTIITGHRRFRAARLAGLSSIDAIIRAPRDDEREIRLIENIQREDLNSVDLEAAVESIYTQIGDVNQVASILGKSCSWVRSKLKSVAVRKSLPEDVQISAKASNLNAKAIEKAAANLDMVVDADKIASNVADAASAAIVPIVKAPRKEKSIFDFKFTLSADGVGEFKSSIDINAKAMEHINKAIDIIKNSLLK